MATYSEETDTIRSLTPREQKRSKYTHNTSSARKNWQDLFDDLFRIGHQYFDYSADLPLIEESVHDAWDELIYIAKSTPSDSSEHDRLLTLIMTVRELGPFARKMKDLDGNEEAAVLSNGQRLWTDLPYLAQDFQNFWINESIGLPVTERENLAVLTSKLCAAGVCSVGLSQCALWLFKEVLETDSFEDGDLKDSRPTLSDLLPACAGWLKYGNYKLAKLCVDDCNPSASKDIQAPNSSGSLAMKATITQQGFSIARWLFWRQRLGELYLSSDRKVSKTARKGFEVMVLTGLRVGIEIQGERIYLESLFEALGKELARLDGPGCVVPDNIDIDPTWATRE